MQFSVIIPTYNRALFLDELLECLVNQRYKNFEVLVCDDGSTDNTKEIVNKYIKVLNLKYFLGTNWGGPARPRNIGIQNAQGEWLCFVDSDDLWHAEKLEAVSKVTHQPVDVICHLFHIKGSEKCIGRYRKTPFYSRVEDFVYNGNRIVNSSLCIRKRTVEQVGGFSENPSFIGVEDYELLIKLALIKARFYCLNRVLGHYRISDTNISGDFMVQIRKIELLLLSYGKLILLNKIKIYALLDYMKGNYFSESGSEKKQARKYYRNTLLKGSTVIQAKALVRLLK